MRRPAYGLRRLGGATWKQAEQNQQRYKRRASATHKASDSTATARLLNRDMARLGDGRRYAGSVTTIVTNVTTGTFRPCPGGLSDAENGRRPGPQRFTAPGVPARRARAPTGRQAGPGGCGGRRA